LAAWKLTIRDGSQVSRLKFDNLDEALEQARQTIEQVLDREPLKKEKVIREYEPEVQVKARVEISGKGLFSPPTAGVDVRGDNSLVSYTGGVARKPLQGDTPKQVIEAMREALMR
jgi:hypothetical protein